MSLLERAKRELVEVPVHIPTLDGAGIAETITVKVEGLRDPDTGELFLDGEALELLDKVKARHMGLLLPEEIKALRLRLNLSQREMSELLHIGEKTYTRWENGRERPSQSLNLLLRALRDGRLDAAYLRSISRVAFNWQIVLSLISSAESAEPSALESEEPFLECAANEELALAA